MAEVKKDEPASKVDELKNKEETAKSNPFESYQSSNPAGDSKKESSIKLTQLQPTEKSHKQNSNSSRSRSREEKPQQGAPLMKAGDPYQVPLSQGNQKFEGKGEKVENPDPNLPPVTVQNMYDEQVTYFKTKVCPLFSKGACKKGPECSFAHGDRELRGLPNFRKTRLCQSYKIGQCPKSSEDCKYAHGEAELRRVVYDYVPEKSRRRTDRPPEHSNDRNQRRPREQMDSKREAGGHRGQRDSRDRRDDSYRDRRDYRGEKERERQYRDRPRQNRDRERDRDYREKERDYRDRERDTRDRYRDERERYNVDYPSRNPEMYAPPPGYGYGSSFNSAYMIPPGPMGYGNPNEMYGPSGPSGASGASGPSQVGGFGSGGPPSSSFSGPSGHSNPGPYGAYGYSYGFVPQPYPPPYNPNSV